ncbi:MAG: minor capsid protein [Fusobacteriaceae bacterium]
MTKSSKEYWEERTTSLSSPVWTKTNVVNKELERIYRQSAKELQQELAEWLSKYQTKHQLDAESMKKIMNPEEAANFRYTVKEYIEKIKELGDSKEAEELLKEFNIMSGKVRFQRYDELEAQMQYQALKLSQKTQEMVQEHLTDVMPEIYNRSIFQIQKEIGVGTSFNQINPTTMESIINTPWNTKNFSNRIWDNKKELVQNLRRTILTGVMQGHEFKRMSQQLQKQMGGEFYKARRILETETTYVLEKAKEESYNELEIEKYIFISTLDNRTSEVCQKMDGKVFRNKDRLQGINVPPLHPFCRSTTAPSVDGLNDSTRFARDKDGNAIKIPANMNYEEWKDKFITQKTEKEITTKILGVNTPNNLEIKGLSSHFTDRVLTRKIEIDDIKNALENPLKIGNTKVEANGESQRFFGKKCEVVINPKTGNLVSVNKISRSKAKKLEKEAIN